MSKSPRKQEPSASAPLLSLRTRPGSFVLSGIWAIGLSVWCILGTLPPAMAIFFSLAIGALRLVQLRPAQWLSDLLGRLLWALGPLLSLYLVEELNNNDLLADLPPLEIALNLVWYYMFFGLVHLIVGRRNHSAQSAAVLCWLAGCANHYIIHFRGRSIFPVDLLTLQTAANVAGGYDYTPCETQAVTLLALMLYLTALSILSGQEKRAIPRLQITIPAAVLSAVYVCVFAFSPMIDVLGIEPSLWTTRGNGFFLNFSVCLKYSQIQEPKGYSVETCQEIADQITGSNTEEADSETTSGSVTPTNIIVIMDETFSELSVDGEVTTTADEMPFIHSLTENTIKGHAWSSVLGGTTANSEYEFLTGNSMAFLPAGSVPYQLFVKPGEHSLVEQLSSLGYKTIAMHPYKRSGWNRTVVYNDMGFDQILFEDDLEGVEYVREYVSDQSDFEQVIKLYEEKEAGEPLFLFNVTMQNHSSYDKPWTNLEETVSLTGDLAGTSAWANQYLSLMHATDEAVEYLISYFSQAEEPTIILFFGDHQPKLSDSFYEEVMGKNPNDLTALEGEVRYETVFFLWANYDIPEAEDVDLSINYLSTLLLEQTDLPLTGYQTFLSGLKEELPIIHATGYWDAAGNYYQKASELPDDLAELVSQYSILQYNNIADRKHTIDGFFTLDGS